MNTNEKAVLNSALPTDNEKKIKNNTMNNGYLITTEAALYMRKSVSWLTRRPDIPYVKGAPNIYKKEDLDSWFERNKFMPQIEW